MGVTKNSVAPLGMEMEKPSPGTAGSEASSRNGAYGYGPGNGTGNGKASKPSGCVGRCGGVISHGVHSAFYSLGNFVAHRPWAVIIVCALVSLLCGAGMMNFQTENRGEKLWVPSGTVAQENKEYVEQYFGSNARVEQFLLKFSDGDSVLSPDAFDAAFALHNKVVAVEADNPEAVGETLTWDNYCLKRGPECTQWNVLDLFNYDPSSWTTREAILNVINDAVPDPDPAAVDDTGTCDVSGGFEITQLLGGITYEGGRIVGASVLSFGYLLQNNLILLDDNSFADRQAQAWEAEYLDLMEAEAAATSQFAITYFSTRSFSDEFGDEINGDVTLLMAAIFAIIVYAILILSRWSEGCSGFRGLLCVGGILSIGMAIVCSFGICSALGLFYSPLMSVLPFLMLGIGVDDMFVIVNAYDNADPELPIPQRVAHALASSGSSVTVTSVTDILAFFIGSFTALPALRNFSIYAAFGIAFDYLFQVTFFVAFLVFDSRRRAQAAPDCLCCCTAPAIACRCCTCCVSGPFDDTCEHYPEGKTPKACCCAPTGFFATDNKMQRLLGAMGRFISKPIPKIVVLVIFAGIIGAGAYGMSQIEVAGDTRNFIPPGSYLDDFVTMADENLNEVGESVFVYIDLDGVSIHDQALLGRMQDMAAAVRDNVWISDCSISALPDLLLGLYSDHLGDKDAFYQALKDTTTGQGANTRYANDLHWDGGRVVSMRISASYNFLKNSNEQVKAMDSLRETVAEKETIGKDTFAFSEEFLTYEGYKSIGTEALRNIGLALLMVLLVIFVLLVHPLGSLITFTTVCIIVVEILGFIHFWGLTIDNVSVIFVVISLGLSVDYSVHITHSFLHKEGTGNERMVAALEDMGTAVMNGVISTWIAVMVLAGSGSYVFATFFKALFLCTTLGMLHGVVLLPIVLSIFNPSTVYSAEEPTRDPGVIAEKLVPGAQSAGDV